MPQADASPLDLQAIHDLLRGGNVSDEWVLGWLPRTWTSLSSFRASLYSAAVRRGTTMRLRSEDRVDLYRDCVLNHLGKRTTALVVGKEGGFVHLPFERLHEQCSALASSWRSLGVAAGESVAIVLPVGADYAKALLCAFRLGLVVTVLPPLGTRYVQARLLRARPDRVVTSEAFKKMLGSYEDRALPLTGTGDATFASSHAYAPAEPMLRLFSPFGDPTAEPYELLAGETHENVLRDSLLVWALTSDDKIAAPGFDPLQTQPFLLLSTWVAGATWVELRPSDLSGEAAPLQALGITILGVSPAVRGTLLRRPPELLPKMVAWFRSMTDVFDYDAWNTLARVMAERRVKGFAVLTNAASGGVHLFTTRTLTPSPLGVWPAPGRTWQISHVGGGTLPALSDSGVYTSLQGKEGDRSLVRVVLARQGQSFVLGGTIDAGPCARALPIHEIAEVASTHEAVAAACLIVLPARFMNDAHVVLLLFTEAEGLAPSISIPEMKALISREMGEVHVPEKIEIFPLRPRWTKGVLDVSWCRSQYLGGLLSAKARFPLFTNLARLGWIFGQSEQQA